MIPLIFFIIKLIIIIGIKILYFILSILSYALLIITVYHMSNLKKKKALLQGKIKECMASCNCIVESVTLRMR